MTTPAHSPKSVTAVVKMTARAAGWRFAAALLAEPAGFAATVLLYWWLKEMVDAASTEGVVSRPIAGFGLTLFAMLVLQAVGTKLRLRVEEQARVAADLDLANRVLRVHSLRPFESAEILDQLQVVRAQQASVAQLPGVAVVLAGHAIRLTMAALLIVAVDGALVALPIAAVLPAAAALLSSRFREQADTKASEERRRAAHLLTALTTPSSAGDVRANQWGEPLRVRHFQAASKAGLIADRAGVRIAALSTIAWAAFLGVFVVAVIRGAAAASAGSPGDLVLLLTLGAQMTGHVSNVFWASSSLSEGFRAARRYARLAQELQRHEGTGTEALPAAMSTGIRFADTGFSYPTAAAPALESVDLVLPVGSTVAIVGANGAGKSTLVKLATGLQVCDTGRVMIDDLDVRDASAGSLAASATAAFQDFARLEFLLRESIGVGCLESIGSSSAVRAAADEAGLGSDIAALTDGLETQLGRAWNGVELSTGQWQRIAIARSRMRRSPLIAVFDEPTASLDPEREAAVFAELSSLTRGARTAGAITLLVTHRLPAARIADLIVVMEEGRVVETGTHEELLKRGGEYATTYLLQAQSYGMEPDRA